MVDTSLQSDAVPIIGDESFREAVAPLPLAAAAPDEPATISVDGKGHIIGDESGIDPNMLAQLQSPEAQEQIKALYRAHRYGVKDQRPEPKYIHQGSTPRRLTQQRPAGMNGREFRRLRRMLFAGMTKAAKKENRDGRERADESHAGIGHAG